MSASNLSDQKRALLAQRLQKARTKKNQPQAITPHPAETNAPLSFSQRRLWFLTQWQPDNPAYNMRSALRLIGDLNVDALQQAFTAVLQRHHVLQMVYQRTNDDDDGEPQQTPFTDLSLPLPLIDLQPLPEDKRESELQRHITAEVHRPFNLATELPIRTTLLQLAPREHVLLLTIHHIASDDWSWRILIEELMACYRAFVADGEPNLPDLPIQYGDFAHWQREWLQGEVLDKQLNYWRQQLESAPTALDLPTDRPHPPIRTHHGGNHTFYLSPSLSRSVQAATQKAGVTPFMFLLTAFQLLLQRYTAQDDIVVGTPIAGRNRSEIEGLIGFFVNTLVLRSNLANNPTVYELLQQIKQTTLSAYDHQDLPFEKLVEELQTERSLSHTPLFQVLFNYHNAPRTSLMLPDLRVERVQIASETAKFDLSLAIAETAEGIRGSFNYNTDLFALSTIERMADHFTTLLEGMVTDLDQSIADLPLLTQKEQKQIAEWHGFAAKYPDYEGIHRLFEAQVEKTPLNTAVSYEGQSYTYQELNQRANQLAHHLHKLGVTADSRVGLFIERSLDILVAMLAVNKTGGAYVPIDPIYPPERIQFMLEDVQASILLTQAELIVELPDLAGIEVIPLDSEWATIATQPGNNLAITVDPKNLMYVLFTSGSTGQPKGVAVEHRNFLNYIHGLIKRLDIPTGLSYAIVSTFAADLGSTNVFGALCSGGEVHIISYERAADPVAFADYFAQNRIDVMKLVPSHFEALQAFGGAEPYIPHEQLIFAGEACSWETIAQVRTARPHTVIHNHYGPTETVVSALNFPVPETPMATHTSAVPLGRPFGNVRAYILDANMRFVPVGVPGELYLGGPGVSRGYLNRPTRTAQSFLPDLWATEPGARMYRTGDRVRYLPDGDIEFLGRLDHQVKIRGYRVELGEIEAMILEDASVQNVTVILREDTPSDKRLVAYIVPVANNDDPVSFTPLRDFLREHLPSYMVPTAFVALPKIPLNPNGKVDRKALPLPEYGRLQSEAEFIAPRTSAEIHIAAIWSGVLEIEQVSIDDNFFDLGGESFKAIRVVRQIGDGISVMDLFKYPTVRELATYLANEQPAADGLLHKLTRTATETVSLVCVPFGGASAIVFQSLAQALPEQYALYSVQIPGHDFACPTDSLIPLPDVAQQCATEIMEKISGPVVLYGHCVGGALAVEIARLLEIENVDVQAVFMGGTFPSPRLPGKLFELLAWSRRRRSNRATFNFLRLLGGFSEGLDPEEQAFMLAGLRHDVQAAEDYYTEAYAIKNRAKLSAPIITVVGEMDRVAEFYEERYQEWAHFSESVDLATIPNAGHYFLKHQATELAQIIDEKLSEVSVRETAVSSPRPTTSTTSLKTFFIVAFGQLISMIGTNLTTFALSIWILGETGQVSQFALVNVFGRVPAILLAPIAGAVADRYDRRLVMIGSDVLAVCGTIILALLYWTESLEIWHIYFTAAIGSVANTFQEPAYTAAVTQIVPKRYLGHANGVVQFSSASGRMLALFLGGVLVITVGLQGVFLIDFITFVVAILTLAFVRFPNTLFRMQEEPFVQEIVRGWEYIIKRKGLVAMIVFFAIVNFFLSIVTVISMPLVLAFESPAVLGIVSAMLGLGMLVGGVVMGLWGGTERRMKGMIGFVALSGIVSIIMGLQPSVVFAAVGFFGLGATGALIDAHWRTLIQTKVGLELQGRVLATNRMLALSTMPLGALAAGFLADKVFEPLMANGGFFAESVGAIIGAGPGRGIALLMIIVGAFRVILAVAGYSYSPLRDMEDDLPDAVPDAVIAADKDALQAQADQQILAQAAAD